MFAEIALFVFWASAMLVLYVYIGYPLLLAVLVRFGFRKPVNQAPIEPSVTLVISAFNEAAVIAEKLRNCLALDYPRDRLEVLVVSDASDDGTDEIVLATPGDQVRLLRMTSRGGKTAGLNRAVAEARGEIMVFSDANAMYDPAVIRNMVRNFNDPTVGAVTGESRYQVEQEDLSARSENRYWEYELALKRLESAVGSLVGGDGAIYAVRKSLYQDLDSADLSDFVNPLQVVAQGSRNVYEPEAWSYERGADSFASEFARKVRIVNRAWRATGKMRALLNPFNYGFFAIQFWSHKVLRWLIGVLLALIFFANLVIAGHAPIYVLALAGQCLIYFAAAAGWGCQRIGITPPRWLEIPYYFCVVNVASIVGILQAVRGRKYTTWQTSRAGS